MRPVTLSIRKRAEIEAARTAVAADDAITTDTTTRLTGGDASTAEGAALEFLYRLQVEGTPYSGAVVALEPWTGLTPAARRAVVDFAYAVGVPPAIDEGKIYRPDSGALSPEINADDLFGDRPIVAQRVKEVATEATITPCMPAMAALAVLSFACAARVKGEARNRDGSLWRMYPNLYLAVEAVSGGKKTYVRKRMGGSMLTSYAKDLRLRYADASEADSYERSIASGRITRLRNSEIAGKPADAAELADARARLARTAVCVPEFLMSIPNSVEWYVSTLLASGFCALMPDEGKEAIKIFVSGKDGKGENCGPLLSAHTVESCNYGSFASKARGDDRLPFDVVCGGAFLPLQPSVLTPMTPHEAQLLAAIQARGLLARTLVARPRQLNVIERAALRARLDNGEIGRTAEAAYDEFVRNLLIAEHGDHPLAPSMPCLLRYTEPANAALLAFQASAEDSAAPGGKHYGEPGTEFVRRQADHVARLSTLLAVIRDGTIRDGTVELQDVERACRVMTNYFLPHALQVARRTVHDPIGNDAEYVWQIVASVGQIGKRELQVKLGAGWGKGKVGDRMSRLDGALEELAERGWVSIVGPERGRKLIRVIGRCV